MHLSDIAEARGEVERRFPSELNKVLVIHDGFIVQAREGLHVDVGTRLDKRVGACQMRIVIVACLHVQQALAVIWPDAVGIQAVVQHQEEAVQSRYANAVKAEIAGLVDVDALLYEVGVDRVVLARPVRAPIAIIQVCSGLDKCFYLSQIAQVVAGDKERAPSAHRTAFQRAVDGRGDEARLLGEPNAHAFHRRVLESSSPKMFYLSVQRMRPCCGIRCRSRADSRSNI